MAKAEAAEEADHKLNKHLGFWSLAATGVGSVIGSGWLLSAQAAAGTAGPASIIAWIIGGLLMLMIALVFAELGMVRPESGGLVRYPLYSNGKLAAAIVGWAMWLTYVGNPPSEASAVVQYASSWWPDVWDGSAGKLTPLGISVAAGLMAIFVVINYFGVQVFARANNLVTAIKVLIPTTTIVLLILSGFTHADTDDKRHLLKGVEQHSHAGGWSNITDNFAPYDMSAALGAIAAGGLIYAYTGFRNVIELSGEAKNPRRDIPRAMITTILFAIVMYLGLQIAFLVSVPADAVEKLGWSGINFDSPFADIAKLLGMSWLYWMLIADSSISPSGSGIVYTAANSRNMFGLAKNGLLPHPVMRINQRGVPGIALVINFIVGLMFLLPLPSWQAIVEVMTAMIALTFAIGSVSVMVFRKVDIGNESLRLPGMGFMAPAAFSIGSLVIFWEDWNSLYKTIPMVAVGAIWYGYTWIRGDRDISDVHGGLWLIGHTAFIYAVASIGNYGGASLLPQPWDSVLVAVGSLAFYYWGVESGYRYLKENDKILEMLEDRSDEITEQADAQEAK